MKTIKDTPRIDFTEKTSTGNEAVDYCETNYPETTKEFKRILDSYFEKDHLLIKSN